ncbi:Cellulase (glycosyl hydrolase family 5 protein) [Ceratobasidium sp. AG-Ba]|nr:Cellulase (glycosyl hydrolase family 5 protein) [Ceratobasidium sp. AG-Ba]
MKHLACALSALAAAGYVSAQQPLYAQCGGKNWTGGTTCVSGSTCTIVNDYYYQCLPGSSSPTTTKAGTTIKPTTTVTSTAPSSTNSLCSGSLTKFKYFGASQSCAEFGESKIPGVLNTDYTWPAQTSIDQLMAKGMNFFRIPFLVERLVPPASGLGGSFDQTYLSGLTSTVNYITNKGGYAAIDPHNYMRYNGAIITSTTDFAKFWTNLATQFKSNSHVIFDIMNEPNGIAASDVFNLNQAAVNAIRNTGATQLILAEGTSWTGAWSWTSSGNAAAFKNLKDPLNNIAIEMHQYLDSDGSGTSGTCVSSTILAERLADATSWLKANNFKGFLGEVGAGSNDACIAAVKGGLCAMQQSGVWLGLSWWAAGPWWGSSYFTSIEPPSGAAIARILPEALQPFM